MKIIVYILLAVLAISILSLLTPLIFLAGLFCLWFYSKKRPDKKKRNYALAAILIGFIGTIGLHSISTKNSQSALSQPKSELKAEAKAGTETTSSDAKEKEKEDQSKSIQAEKMLSSFENETSRENYTKTFEAINQVKDSKEKEGLQSRFKIAEQRLLAKEAETELKQLETTQSSNYVETTKQKLNLISDPVKKEELQKRIDTVVSAIEAQKQAAAQKAQEEANQQQAAQSPDTNQRHYANCTEMRNAGAAPIPQGQAGYEPRLDRDHDGWACE
ncbi:excalibur calcium-binding domain-containing protein [Streptococcus catagoni]